MKLQQNLKLQQRLVMAPYMRQSFEVLMMPYLDLTQAIQEEAEKNPMLEVQERTLPSISETTIQKTITENPLRASFSSEDNLKNLPLTAEESMEAALIRQIRLEFHNPLDIRIGELVVGSLNPDGYLLMSSEEIAQTLTLPDTARIETVIKRIQRLDPPGLAARSLEECLLAQVEDGNYPQETLIRSLIRNHLNDIALKRFDDLASQLKVDGPTLHRAVEQIRHLDPKPGRRFAHADPQLYIKPDLKVRRLVSGEFALEMNRDEIPVLRVNPVYEKMLKQRTLKQEEKSFIRDKIKNARQFIRAVEQRGRTLLAVGEVILKRQKDFFEKGHWALVPMSLKDVAEAIERNESTVCRAIQGKYIETPLGVYPLKFFFSQSLTARIGTSREDSGNNISNRSLKEEIRELIDKEDKSNPLTDQAIQEHFQRRGVPIARRTVAKYRKLLRILPSHLRKI